LAIRGSVDSSEETAGARPLAIVIAKYWGRGQSVPWREMLTSWLTPQASRRPRAVREHRWGLAHQPEPVEARTMSKSNLLPTPEWVGVLFKATWLVMFVGLLLLMAVYGPRLRAGIARVSTRVDAALRSLDVRAGRYQLAVTVDRGDLANVWRLDTVTGEVTLCARSLQRSPSEPGMHPVCKAVES
jgi:hypothetical protein